MNDDLTDYVEKFKIQNEFNHRLKIKREFKIALIKIKKFQKFIFEKIIEIYETSLSRNVNNNSSISRRFFNESFIR